MDEESGSLYYRNNVSGETQWEMPDTLDILVGRRNMTMHAVNVIYYSYTRMDDGIE